MKKGDVIGGYRVVTEPTNAGGGKCVWAFAEKDGEQYFLKRFLEPKRPREGGGGSAESRRIRTENCRRFEERHRTVMDLLRPDVPGAGNLVLATDFFFEGSTYYKVTERIDTSGLDRPHTLAPPQLAVLLRTLGTSLRMLHRIDVVHGDLKPANILVRQRIEGAFHTAKLIDFDDAYVAREPPGRDEIAGDSVYGAPEWRRYVRGSAAVDGADLTTAVDVFALGLITHLWLTGELPGHDGRFGSPADAVNAGEPLAVDPRLGPATRRLVKAMAARDPGDRPSAEEFVAALKDPAVCALGEPRRESRLRVNLAGRKGGSVPDGGKGAAADPVPAQAPDAPAPPDPGTATPSRVAETPDAATPDAAPAPDTSSSGTPAASRVRINLGGRTGRRPTTPEPRKSP
ncbi:serine/threonine protein kinase [Actinacidiphila yanglinensis]|uniref:Serine/threonine protein kinase n=1 Tax=Actinacidiphila yanglinensis TaxID=310779 RepID=A0A1H5YPD1_9ACTN|nr:lipopolysaccharide kinase InaA family protein [Actinacidiphila yanglinensis]SEG25532.1 serine/threonine protein kinase [Actinacidiphila yanglinensis]